jgi:hypothetical protein
MPNVKDQYKIERVYNSNFNNIKTVRENLTERQAMNHCKSKEACGTEDGKSYRDFYTYM